MNKAGTQFWVAVMAVGFVGAANLMLIWGAICRDVDLAVAMAAFSGLTAISGASSAWLFRLNGVTK